MKEKLEIILRIASDESSKTPRVRLELEYSRFDAKDNQKLEFKTQLNNYLIAKKLKISLGSVQHGNQSFDIRDDNTTEPPRKVIYSSSVEELEKVIGKIKDLSNDILKDKVAFQVISSNSYLKAEGSTQGAAGYRFLNHSDIKDFFESALEEAREERSKILDNKLIILNLRFNQASKTLKGIADSDITFPIQVGFRSKDERFFKKNPRIKSLKNHFRTQGLYAADILLDEKSEPRNILIGAVDEGGKIFQIATNSIEKLERLFELKKVSEAQRPVFENVVFMFKGRQIDKDEIIALAKHYREVKVAVGKGESPKPNPNVTLEKYPHLVPLVKEVQAAAKK